jgi:hypothetical protein
MQFLTWCQTEEQRNEIVTLQAEDSFNRGDVLAAATFFAQSSKPFEEVTLRFMDKKSPDALREYLLLRLDKLKRTVSIS